MLDNGDVREDLRVPDSDLGKEIESKFAAGEEMLVSASIWAIMHLAHFSARSVDAECRIFSKVRLFVFQVTVLSAMGEESAVAVKPMTK